MVAAQYRSTTTMFGIDTEPARELAARFLHWDGATEDLIIAIAIAETRCEMSAGVRPLLAEVGQIGRTLAAETVAAVEELESHRLALGPSPTGAFGLIGSLADLVPTWCDVPTRSELIEEIEAYRDGTHPDLNDFDPDIDPAAAAEQGVADLIDGLVDDPRVAAGLAGLVMAGVPLDEALVHKTGQDFEILFQELREAMENGEPPGARGLPIGVFPVAYVERYPDADSVLVNHLGAFEPGPISNHPDDSADHPLHWTSWQIVNSIADHNGSGADVWFGRQLPEFMHKRLDEIEAFIGNDWVAVGFFNGLGPEGSAFLPAELTPPDPDVAELAPNPDLVAELVAPFADALARASWHNELEFTGAEMIRAVELRFRGHTTLAPPEHMLLAEGFAPGFLDEAIVASIDLMSEFVYLNGTALDPGPLTIAAAEMNGRFLPLVDLTIRDHRFETWVAPAGRRYVGAGWPDWRFHIPLIAPDLGRRVMYYIADRPAFHMDGVAEFLTLMMPETIDDHDLIPAASDVLRKVIHRGDGGLIVVAMDLMLVAEMEAQVNWGANNFDWDRVQPVLAMVSQEWGERYIRLRDQDRFEALVSKVWKYGRLVLGRVGVGGLIWSGVGLLANFDTDRESRAVRSDIERIAYGGFDLGQIATELIFESGRVQTADGAPVRASIAPDGLAYTLTNADTGEELYSGELGTTDAIEIFGTFVWTAPGADVVQVGTAVGSVRTLVDELNRIFGRAAFPSEDDEDEDR